MVTLLLRLNMAQERLQERSKGLTRIELTKVWKGLHQSSIEIANCRALFGIVSLGHTEAKYAFQKSSCKVKELIFADCDPLGLKC